MDESFGGSLPAFIAAFTSARTLTKDETEAIIRMIERSGKE